MPGPFPGMDPYLEHPALWPGVHQGLIYLINEALNASLPPGFAANIDERLYIVQPDRHIYPDVAVLEYPSVRPTTEAAVSRTGGTAVAVAEADPSYLITIQPVEIREPFIEIFAVGESERIVAVIEVLSHANKAPGSTGRELYLTKQRQVLGSQAHLLEIDLLRSGAHTVPPPPEHLNEQKEPWDYLVCLHRAGQGRSFEVWLRTVRERLPRVRVPLTEGEPDVILDLQATFDRCYDAGPYRRRVDYRGEPTPPLSSGDASWADALLRERGLRP